MPTASLSVASPASPFSPELFPHQQSCTPNTGNGGNYYHYQAATAGNSLDWSGQAISTICPTGWFLPRYENDKSFKNLGAYYNIPTGGLVVGNPMSFTLSGFYEVDHPFRRTETGSFMTFLNLTPGNPIDTHYSQNSFDVYDNFNINYDGESIYWRGVSLRCVAR